MSFENMRDLASALPSLRDNLDDEDVPMYPPPPELPRTTNSGSRHPGKSVVAKPDLFDGSKDKYVQWRRSLILYLAGYEHPPSSSQKIMITLSYMRGDNAAGRFADLYAIQHQSDFRDISWAGFCNELDTMFFPVALRRQAEQKLLVLKQNKSETVSDFFVRMKQLIAEAEYSTEHNGRTLINVARTGLKNEVVELVERSQPELIDSDDFEQWERSLIRGDQVLAEIAARKKDSGSITWPRRPQVTSTTTTTPRVPTAASSTNTVATDQAGTFGGQGIPMDLSRARAEGKCVRCGKAWPCAEHFRPRPRQIRVLEFRGQKIEYTTADELADSISRIEKDFPTGA